MPGINIERRPVGYRWTWLLVALIVVALVWWIVGAAATAWRRDAESEVPRPTVPAVEVPQAQ